MKNLDQGFKIIIGFRNSDGNDVIIVRASREKSGALRGVKSKK
ncbi:hypothetical protein [Bartonella sp. AU15XJBT]|nr:hypothetical protein [Bartonella sp. AU15XJBT]